MKTIQLFNTDVLKLVLAAALTYFIMSTASSSRVVMFSAPTQDTTTVPSWIDDLPAKP